MSFMGHAQFSVARLGKQEKVWPTMERDSGEHVEGTTPPCSQNAKLDSKSTTMRSSSSKIPSRKSTSSKSPAPSLQKTSPPKTLGQRITRSSLVAAQSNIGIATSPMKTRVEDEDLLLLHYAKAKTSHVKQKLNLSGRATRSTH